MWCAYEATAVTFEGYKPRLFYMAYLDLSIRTDAITNNMAETFNSYIIQAKTKHVIFILVVNIFQLGTDQ